MWMVQERAKMAHVFYIPQTEVEPETVKVYSGERALSMQLAVCKTPQQSGSPHMGTAQERAKMAHVFYIPQTEVEP